MQDTYMYGDMHDLSEPDNGSATYLALRERANELGFATVGEALEKLAEHEARFKVVSRSWAGFVGRG